METSTKRKPLLSDRGIKGMIDDVFRTGLEDFEQVACSVRDYYETKISRGELMVVKTANLISGHEYGKGFFLVCDQCKLDLVNANIGQRIKFCPGCGARIVE